MHSCFSDRIPYVAIYDKRDQVRQKGYFIPGYGVTAVISKAERDTGTHLINPYM